MQECLGVIGDPIHHSLSPNMHNRLFERYQLPHFYHPFHVKGEDLEDAIKGIKALGLRGINITIPHKVAIIPFLDYLDPEAEMIGAVNTVVNREGKLYGYNTDGLGFLTSLKEWVEGPLDFQNTLMIGAGGAARAVALTLAKHLSCQIDVANRTKDKAQHLISELNEVAQGSVLSIHQAEQELNKYDLIINSTPVGMYPNEGETPLSLENVKEGARCVDLIYRPLQTKWLKEAQRKGCPTMNGVGMLVHQGALAFQHWFNIWPDTVDMAKHLREDLEAKHVK